MAICGFTDTVEALDNKSFALNGFILKGINDSAERVVTDDAEID